MHGRMAELGPSRMTLTVTADEAAALRVMLREQMSNDLDLLEDLAYAQRLTSPESDAAVARVSLAVRLDVALG